MTLEERLEQCGKCLNRSFDTEIGNTCKLTRQTPDFEGRCESYQHDKKTDVLLERDTIRDRMVLPKSQEVSATKKFFTNGIFLGIVLILVGLIWFVIGMANDYIYFYPFVLIIGGIIAIVQAAMAMARDKQNAHLYGDRTNSNSDLLDT